MGPGWFDTTGLVQLCKSEIKVTKMVKSQMSAPGNEEWVMPLDVIMYIML